MYYICIYIYLHYIVLISFLNCILPNSIAKLASNFEVDAIKSYLLINLVQDFYKVLNNKGKNFALRGDEVVDIIPSVGCLATPPEGVFFGPWGGAFRTAEVNVLYEIDILRSSGNSNPFISICNRNAEPSAQAPIPY